MRQILEFWSNHLFHHILEDLAFKMPRNLFSDFRCAFGCDVLIFAMCLSCCFISVCVAENVAMSRCPLKYYLILIVVCLCELSKCLLYYAITDYFHFCAPEGCFSAACESLKTTHFRASLSFINGN